MNAGIKGEKPIETVTDACQLSFDLAAEQLVRSAVSIGALNEFDARRATTAALLGAALNCFMKTAAPAGRPEEEAQDIVTGALAAIIKDWRDLKAAKAKGLS